MCAKLLLTILITNIYASSSADVNLTWIFKCNSSIGYTHMPTIEVIPNKNGSQILLAAWQASKQSESDNDQHIMGSISYNFGEKWTTAKTWAVSERYKMALWGPVLLWDDNNQLLWLFYSESTPSQIKSSSTSYVGGNILYKTSKDYGISWSNWTEILSFNTEGNTSKVTANKPCIVHLQNGTTRWILPFWQESSSKYNSTQNSAARVLISDNFGISWNVFGYNDDHYLIENTVTSIKDSNGNDTGIILQLFRSGGTPLWQSWSYDYGNSWSKANATKIPNPNSKVFVFTDSFNEQILAYNPTTSGRHPIGLAKSIDGGHSFKEFVDLDSIDTSLAYPTSVEVIMSNGDVIVYTDFSANTHNGIKLAWTKVTK